MKIKCKMFLIPIIISVILNIIFVINKEINAHNLSNSFFFTSIIFLGIGAYSYVLKKGAFSGLSYSIRRIRHLIFNPKGTFESPRSYYEQYEYDLENRKENLFHVALLLIGLANLLAAIVFTYLV